MSTERPVNGGDTDKRAPRFRYHAEDEPSEGGVRGASKAGAPGVAERLLDISELARTLGMQYTHRFHIPPWPEDDIEFVAPLDGEIMLTNTGAVLLLRGSVRTRLKLECGRCLEPTTQEVETEIEEEFDLVASRNAFHQDEMQAVDEDTPASVVKGNVLNLGELLRQDLLLAAPLQPLCREDCPGIAVGDGTFADQSEIETPLVRENPLRRLAELLNATQQTDKLKEE